MNIKIKDQIVKLYRKYKIDLFDIHKVQLLALEENYYGLAIYIRDHPKEYISIINSIYDNFKT